MSQTLVVMKVDVACLAIYKQTLSRVDPSDMHIHRNNSEPDRLKAYVFMRGTDIILAHEAWHVVQQKQGRVQANSSFRGQVINSSPSLESEAYRMAQRVTSMPVSMNETAPSSTKIHRSASKIIAQLAPNQEGTADPQHLIDFVRRLEAEGLSRSEILGRVSEDHASNSNRYIYTDRYGWVDLRHFGAAGSLAQSTGSVVAEGLGLGNEIKQWLSEWGDDYRSGFSPEDIPSNAAGAAFGDDFVNEDEPLSDSLDRWLEDAGARTQSDPLSGRSSLPQKDPSVRGGTNRGSSNASRTRSTVSDNETVNEFTNEWNSGWRALATPGGWYRLFGM